MDWIIWVAIIIMGGLTIGNMKIRSQITRAIEGKPTVLEKMLEEPKPAHRLMRTWIVTTQEGKLFAGWRWKCSCGVWGTASDAFSRFDSTSRTTKYSMGTEKQAIAGFKEHSAQYSEVNTDFYKEKFEQVSAEFAEYRSLCYCKDANDALLPWRNK